MFRDCLGNLGTRDTQTQCVFIYSVGCPECSGTDLVTWVHGIPRRRSVCTYCGLSRIVLVTWVHGILRCRGVCITLGCLGCSGTVLVTWVHGILRCRGVCTYCGLSGMFRDSLGNLGTRDTQMQGCMHLLWAVRDVSW